MCDVSTLIDGKMLDHSKMSKYFHDIAVGVHDLHSLGVIHQDIKTCNILYNQEEDRMILCDLGMVNINMPHYPYFIPTYSSVYAPPEVFAQGTMSLKSDIWALGVTFYIMLTGYLPPPTQDRIIRYCRSLSSQPYHRVWKDIYKKYRMVYDPCVESRLLCQVKDPTTLSLLTGMLEPDANDRFDISQVFDHPYFSTMERPIALVREPYPTKWHAPMLRTKKILLDDMWSTALEMGAAQHDVIVLTFAYACVLIDIAMQQPCFIRSIART